MQCKQCDNEFEAKRADAQYCSEKCKKRSQRATDNVPDSVVPDNNVPDKVMTNVPDKVSVTKRTDITRIIDGIAHFAKDEPEWRKTLINEILEGKAEGTLEENEKYGTLIHRSPEQARKYDMAKDNAYRAAFHNSVKRDAWSNLK